MGGWEAYLDSLAAFGMRPGLERVEALLAALGDPQRTFPAVHVVGTNGKSSTTRYTEALLRAHGLRSAAYLSPHITGYDERVVIDGAPIGGESFGRAVERVRAAVAELPAALGDTTQFEVLTVAALAAMAEEGCRRPPWRPGWAAAWTPPMCSMRRSWCSPISRWSTPKSLATRAKRSSARRRP